ncbi:MAG: hypothetical protein GX591_04635, partial [Planctomycetes bacterium]|nr:hypothetical protein [Planctomycetota bacterium]
QPAETQPAETQPAEVPDYLLKGEARRRLREMRAEDQAQALAGQLLMRAQEEVALSSEDDEQQTAGAAALQTAVEAMADTAPVRFVAADAWMGPMELRRDQVLGAAMTAQGMGLPQAAMQTAELLDEADRSAAATSVGTIFPQIMRVYGARAGFLVWRVTAARESSVPESITPQIREALTRDWQATKAYGLAVQAANDAMARVGETALETVAADRGMQVQQAEGLRRLGIANALEAGLMLGEGYEAYQAVAALGQFIQSQGQNREALAGVRPEGFVMAAVQKPLVQLVPPVQALGYVGEGTRRAFLDAVFAMVPPADAETAPLTASQPAPAEAVKLVELPGAMAVVIAQRVQYTPAYEEDYQEQRANLMRALALMDRYEALWMWMDPAQIQARTGLKLAEAPPAAD